MRLQLTMYVIKKIKRPTIKSHYLCTSLMELALRLYTDQELQCSIIISKSKSDPEITVDLASGFFLFVAIPSSPAPIMSGRDGDIFAFDSSENIVNGSSLESINFEADDSESLLTPVNYQALRRIEHAKSLLRNHSLLAYESMQTGEPICYIRAKLKLKLCTNWTPEREEELLSSDKLKNSSHDYTIVTPSHNFVELDEEPQKGGSYGGSYQSGTSFKSPDRLKYHKNL